MLLDERQLFDLLPYLRRYARALTGGIDSGDDLITRAIEVAILAPGPDGAAVPPRAAFYTLLHRLFDLDTGGEGRPAPSPHPIERSLAGLAETDRRVYLLATLEDLPLTEVAAVMRLPLAEARRRLLDAREAVRGSFTQRVLVVEDNPLLAMEIGSVIADMGHIVCGTAGTAREALDLAEAERPTLALLDVRLADGNSGVDVARRLRGRKSLRTIFVTGFDGDLEEADARHLGQIVRKPFTREAIGAAISRAMFMPGPVALA